MAGEGATTPRGGRRENHFTAITRRHNPVTELPANPSHESTTQPEPTTSLPLPPGGVSLFPLRRESDVKFSITNYEEFKKLSSRRPADEKSTFWIRLHNIRSRSTRRPEMRARSPHDSKPIEAKARERVAGEEIFQHGPKRRTRNH